MYRWTKQLPAKPGLYWVKSPDGHPEVLEHFEGMTWSSGLYFCGPIQPPGSPPGQTPKTKPDHRHLTATGFVRKVRSSIKQVS